MMLVHKGTLDIETDRLILRRFVESDADDMFNNWANDDDVTRYLTWPTHKDIDVSKIVISDWVEGYKNDEFYQWAIMLKENEKVIGSISVVELSNTNEHCDIGYCIGKAYWNKGMTTEALKAIILFLFNEIGFERVQALHYTENVASGEVMKKAGMTYEGRRRKFHKNLDGVFVDCDAYAILKEDKRDY